MTLTAPATPHHMQIHGIRAKYFFISKNIHIWRDVETKTRRSCRTQKRTEEVWRRTWTRRVKGRDDGGERRGGAGV